jgi:hypothetical protein
MHIVHLVANPRRMVATMSNQPNQPIIGHPKTAAEIRQALRLLADRDRVLTSEGADIYRAMQKGDPLPQPLSDHQRRVTGHIQSMMNGSTPAHLLAPAVSRDDQIRAERDAIAFVSRELCRKAEQATHDEAELWVVENDKLWRALCREIVLAAIKLATLEERARKMIMPIEGAFVRMPMGATIGSGLSLLGIGDPLREMRETALNEKIVTQAEIRKASE